MVRIDLTPIANQKGVLAALFLRHGHLVAAAGPQTADATILAVLAEAMLSAANGLGARTGSGDCVEIATTHAAAGFVLFNHPNGCQLIVRCDPSIDLAQVRCLAHTLLSETGTTPAPAPAHSDALALADALNAGPP